MIHDIDIVEELKPVERLLAEIAIDDPLSERPRRIEGRFIDVSSRGLLRLRSHRKAVYIAFAGSRYRLASLTAAGGFELVADWTAATLRELENERAAASRCIRS